MLKRMQTAVDLFKHTVYINLEHRVDRKTHVEAEMRKLGITPTRFNAIKTKSGAIGCSMSHLACLQMAKTQGWPQVFIAEDDICFTNPDLLVTQVNKFLVAHGDNWDVLLVAGNNAPPHQPIGDYCVRVANCRAATGYVVRSAYYDVLINNFKCGLQGLIKNPEDKPNYACDMYWMRLQATDRWYLIVPLTVYQIDGYSDIEERHTDYRELMVDLEKTWLKAMSTGKATPTGKASIASHPEGVLRKVASHPEGVLRSPTVQASQLDMLRYLR